MNFGNITRRTKHYLLMGLLSTLSGVTLHRATTNLSAIAATILLCSAPKVTKKFQHKHAGFQ